MEIVHPVRVRLVAGVFIDYLACGTVGGGKYAEAGGAEVFGPVLGVLVDDKMDGGVREEEMSIT